MRGLVLLIYGNGLLDFESRISLPLLKYSGNLALSIASMTN
jgi:hypothetical protein